MANGYVQSLENRQPIQEFNFTNRIQVEFTHRLHCRCRLLPRILVCRSKGRKSIVRWPYAPLVRFEDLNVAKVTMQSLNL